MSRLKHFANSMVSSYLLLGTNVLFTLASVPLALHYLSKEYFGLWMLISSIGNYFSLIDLGMSSAVARLLIDHKDERDGGVYGSLIKTGWAVSVAQGVIIFLVGFVLAPFLGDLMKLQSDTQHPQMQAEFIALLRWQLAVMGAGLCLRIFSHVLLAHQRTDIYNYSQIAALVLNFVVVWWFFHSGRGVFSLVWAGWVGAVTVGIIWLWQCRQLGLLPSRGAWGRVSTVYFKEMFGYGKDLFLVSLGTQLVMASQTMIITRRLGLEAAAVWGVGLRAFNLVGQLVWRIMVVASPAFSEMIVRGETGRLRERFRDITVVSAALVGFTAVIFAASNSLFVEVWTNGRIHWPVLNDVLLGLWLIVLTVGSCNTNLILITKQIGFLRYAFFCEGCVFVVAAWFASGVGGLAAIIACSVLCSTFCTGVYGFWRSRRYFDLPLEEIAGTWLAPMGRVLTLFAPMMLAVWFAARPLEVHWRLAVIALASVVLGGPVFLRHGLSASLQSGFMERMPVFTRPAFGMILGRRAAV